MQSLRHVGEAFRLNIFGGNRGNRGGYLGANLRNQRAGNDDFIQVVWFTGAGVGAGGGRSGRSRSGGRTGTGGNRATDGGTGGEKRPDNCCG